VASQTRIAQIARPKTSIGLVALTLVAELLLPSAVAQTNASSRVAALNQSSSRISISGRVVAQPGASITSAVGLRVSASPVPQQDSSTRTMTATVAPDWSFRMTGLPGSYRFTVAADRPPGVKATRVTVDGVDSPASESVELTEGTHEITVVVAPREAPAPAFDRTASLTALVEQFKNEKASWRQFAIAQEIVARRDASVLPSLASWLNHDNRRIRGNVAFIFVALGDPRGFQVITEILTDQTDRPPGEITGGNWTLKAQIRSDRYYAAHLLGDLRDPRGVPVLVALLKDRDIHSIVPWALGQIGGKQAIEALLDMLGDDDPSMRVLTIYALDTLNAKEAAPRLIPLLDDHRKSNFGAQVTVADAAGAALAKLK
jgi:HEAT repeats